MQVTQEECDFLKNLYKEAQNTPVIAITTQDALEGKDLANQAWNRVRDYMDTLAEKYGYDPSKYAINPDTREIVRYG